MVYFLALIPATGLTIAGYFVLYLANRSEGAFRTFGKYLAFWAFTLAALVVLGTVFAAAHHCRHGSSMVERDMHGPMHAPWSGDPRSFGPRGGEQGESQGGPAPSSPASAAPPATH